MTSQTCAPPPHPLQPADLEPTVKWPDSTEVRASTLPATDQPAGGSTALLAAGDGHVGPNHGSRPAHFARKHPGARAPPLKGHETMPHAPILTKAHRTKPKAHAAALRGMADEDVQLLREHAPRMVVSFGCSASTQVLHLAGAVLTALGTPTGSMCDTPLGARHKE